MSIQTQTKPEPTREQDQALDAFAAEYDRCRCQMLDGGLMLAVALVDDVELERRVYDVDGQPIASHVLASGH